MIGGITNDSANRFGVDESDVQVDLYYTTSGTLVIENPNDLSKETVEEELQNAIATVLGNPLFLFLSLPCPPLSLSL